MAKPVRFVPPPIARLRAAQVNIVLEALVIACLATGLMSWTLGTGWARWATVTHAVCGLSILVIAPAKMQRSVRTGLRRQRTTRWLSIAFGVLVITTVAVGISHATGMWYGVGTWSALWLHIIAAAAVVPFFAWHVAARPVPVRRVDLDRRMLIGGAAVAGIAAAAYSAQEVTSRALHLAGGDRRFTGSHETASYDPEHLPAIAWFDDTKPSVERVQQWRLSIAGNTIDMAALHRDARPLDAVIDCTGGWWSAQSWDVVPLSNYAAAFTDRSLRVTSFTGYSRLFPVADLDGLYLATGYGGQPLRRRHGAPVRLVAPGRRGPWWVKWVTSVEPDDRFWWLQLPFPAT